jgi:CheY-like chemotaxis protein
MTADGVDALANLLTALLWPAVVGVALWLFRSVIAGAVASGRNVKLNLGGHEIEIGTLAEQQSHNVEDLLRQVTELTERLERLEGPAPPDAGPEADADGLDDDGPAAFGDEALPADDDRTRVLSLPPDLAPAGAAPGRPERSAWFSRGPAAPGAFPRAEKEAAPGRARVLWVDDEPQNNVQLVRTLDGLDVDVTQVTSTTQAQAALRAGGYELVISDIGRPEGERAGLDLLSALRASGEEVPMVFFCGPWASRHLADAAQALGATGITSSGTRLLGLVRGVLDGTRVRG